MDILEIAEKTGIEESVCRENYLRNPLNKENRRYKTTKSQEISKIEGSDNYLILVDTVEEVIEIVGEITRIKIPHKDFQWIPLDVGICTKEIDENIPVEPISRTEVIALLKDDIINSYKRHIKSKICKME